MTVFFNEDNFTRSAAVLRVASNAFLRATGFMTATKQPLIAAESNFYEVGVNYVWTLVTFFHSYWEKVLKDLDANLDVFNDSDSSKIVAYGADFAREFNESPKEEIERDVSQYKQKLYSTHPKSYYAVTALDLCVQISCAIAWIILNLALAAVCVPVTCLAFIGDFLQGAGALMGSSPSIPVQVTPPVEQDSFEGGADHSERKDQAQEEESELQEQAFIAQVENLKERALRLDSVALAARHPESPQENGVSPRDTLVMNIGYAQKSSL